jgi:hypothetical protein
LGNYPIVQTPRVSKLKPVHEEPFPTARKQGCYVGETQLSAIDLRAEWRK